MARVLITGGTGLLGRHTLAAWPPSLEATVVDRGVHDLLVPGAFAELIRDVRPDAVLHLAWSASSTPGYRSSRANAGWRSVSMEAAEACLDLNIRFIGTGTVLDSEAGGDTYIASKSALRAGLASSIDVGDITWLRPHYVFDPEQPSPAVLRAARAAKAAGHPVALATPGATHDFVHAADVGHAIVASVIQGLTGPVDIGSGQLRAVSALVEGCGATWTTASVPTILQHASARADIAPLIATGWHPSHTDGYFTHD